MSSALNRSSAIQHFKGSDAIKICVGFLHKTATIMFYLCDICCPEYILSDRTDLLVFLALYDIVSKELPATFLRFVEAILGLLEFDLQEGQLLQYFS